MTLLSSATVGRGQPSSWDPAQSMCPGSRPSSPASAPSSAGDRSPSPAHTILAEVCQHHERSSEDLNCRQNSWVMMDEGPAGHCSTSSSSAGRMAIASSGSSAQPWLSCPAQHLAQHAWPAVQLKSERAAIGSLPGTRRLEDSSCWASGEGCWCMWKLHLQYKLNRGWPGLLLCSTNLMTRLLCPQKRMSRPLHACTGWVGHAAAACSLHVHGLSRTGWFGQLLEALLTQACLSRNEPPCLIWGDFEVRFTSYCGSMSDSAHDADSSSRQMRTRSRLLSCKRQLR